MTQPPSFNRSQSTTSLAQLHNGVNGADGVDAEELNDPRLDFCNSFWGQGERGYEVIMARLRGAGRTIEELRVFWKERAAIEEEYAKKLVKLAKVTLGRDEIGDLAASLQNVLTETGQQASYHQALSTELRQSVEQPMAEFGVRLNNMKKGLQGSVEKSYRNKGLQEGHVVKAKEKYESDCLKINSHSANSQLAQGKDFERYQSKMERVRQTIGGNEQDFKQFVRVLEGTTQKWENEWKAFCDHVQDMEEDRLALTKDIIWAYANAVSQVCVEDDSSCERVRERLESLEPQNDMVAFVKGWGTGDMIPDPPRFINYSAGEYPSQPTFRHADFRRISSKPPLSAVSRQNGDSEQPVEQSSAHEEPPSIAPPISNGIGRPATTNSMADSPGQLNMNGTPPAEPERKPPFGGVALPGMGATPAPSQSLPARQSSMQPPPIPPSMTMPEPRIPSRQGPPTPRDINDQEDPMARALAQLRNEPPPPASVRRGPSSRRPESLYSTNGSVRGSTVGHGVKSPPSPSPNRMSYQQQSGPPMSPPQSRSTIDMTLSPPASGHTAAALQRSMDDFHRTASRGPSDNRHSVNYSSLGEDVVGAHPSSRPNSPAGNRSPSPSAAMMQPPIMPPSPVADEVLSRYHQQFPGEQRSRSRAGSVVSNRSRATSVAAQPVGQAPGAPSGPPRAGFVGIGAGGGRSPSPQPPAFRLPSPSPVVTQGALGQPNLGIALDEEGGVAHDSMAEAYRRQYQQTHQQQPPQAQQGQPQSSWVNRPQSQFGNQPASQPSYGQQQHGGQSQPRSQQTPKSPSAASFSGAIQGRPVSGYGAAAQQHPQQQQAQQYGQAQQQPSYRPQQQQYPSSQQQAQQMNQPQQTNQTQQSSYQRQNAMSPSQGGYGAINGYTQQSQPMYAPQNQQQFRPQQNQFGHSGSHAPQQNQYARAPSPAHQQNHFARASSPAPQHNQYARAPSPAPQQNYGYHAPSPQPSHGQQQQMQQQRAGRSPSPQPNHPPPNTAPTGQWSTTGLPILFYVKALYDYTTQSGAEFDFQAGDIIAVTSTPEDGWWSGELLDEARRVPGRNDFPSNFVCLF